MGRIVTMEDLERVVEEYGFLPYSGDKKEMLFSLGGMTDNVWHDDSDADPWVWRAKVAAKGEIAYGKFFRRKSGFIARRCIPAFVAVRRDGRSFEELYEEGLVSRAVKRVWDCFAARPIWTHQDLRGAADFGSGETRAFDSALAELQMLLFICVSGQSQKVNKQGQPYGWHTNDFGRLDAMFPTPADEALTRREGEALLLECIAAVGDYPEKAALRLLRSGAV
jgi:hypothetical protein